MVSIFSKVVHIGPRPVGAGGVVAVLKAYQDSISDFYLIESSYSRFSGLGNILFVLYGMIKALLCFIFKRVEIVHIHSSAYRSFYRESVFVILSRIFRKKIVLHIHGGDFIKFYQEHRSYCDGIFKYVDAIITVSNFLNQGLSAVLSKQIPIETIPNPIFPPKNTGGEGIDKVNADRVNLLFLGVLNDNKGIMMVLDVLRKYKCDFEDRVHFHIGGGGVLRDKVIQYIQDYSLDSYVTYHGWVAGEQKNNLLERASLYIQPSEFEAFGIAIIEAMSYGSAIIASNRGGIPEIVSPNINGFLIEPRDEEALRACIITLIEDKALMARISEANREKAKEYYIDNVVSRLSSVYQKVISKKI